jgi:hypothetical protein
MAGGGLERAQRRKRRQVERHEPLSGMSSFHALHEKSSLVKAGESAHVDFRDKFAA